MSKFNIPKLTLKENVDESLNGVQSCINFKSTNHKDTIDRNMIKKGMVIIDDINKYKNNNKDSKKWPFQILKFSSDVPV